jgi:hypothetical protein
MTKTVGAGYYVKAFIWDADYAPMCAAVEWRSN